MASTIDPTFPVAVNPTTQSVRDNFQHAHDEISALQAGSLPLAGGTMTGPLVLSGDPTQALGAVTKQYADAKAPLLAPVFQGDARAVTPALGDNDTSIATTAFVQQAAAPALTNAGRNLLDNPTFLIQQRGTGLWNAAFAYTADRWQLYVANGSLSVGTLQLTDGYRSGIGDEAAVWGLNCVTSGGGATGSIAVMIQRIENVRRLSGKTVTVSFWVAASIAAARVGVSFDQVFGSGGSPSPSVSGAVQSVAITNVIARYSMTFAIPSAAGKTLGTAGDHTVMNIWLSASADQGANAPPVQNASFVFWGMQLEIGAQVTPLDKPDWSTNWQRCRRHYAPFSMVMIGNVAGGAGAAYGTFPLSIQMRASPSVTFGAINYGNATSLALFSAGTDQLTLSCSVTGAGGYFAYGPVQLSADL
jgi:hypothetical protein